MYRLVPTPHNLAIWDQISSKDSLQGVIGMGQTLSEFLHL